MHKKSICFYTVSHPMFHLGGAELQSYYYAREFARQGWHVYFLSRDFGEVRYKFDNGDIEIILYEESKLFFLNWIILFWKLFIIRADVYYYRYHKYHLGIIFLVCFIKRKKYAWVPMLDPYCTKDAAIMTARQNLQNINKISKIFYLAKLSLEHFLFNIGVKFDHWTIVQNKFQEQTIMHEFNKKIFRIYNSHPVAQRQSNRKDNILFIATFKDFKNPELFCQIADSFKVKKYQFIMVGGNFTDAQRKEDVEKIIKVSNVEYLNGQSIETVNRLLSEAKLLINTSSYEGFPNTFIQAWMRGVPVISLKVDPDRLIAENELGFCCDGDLNLLKEKILLLMEDQELWERYSIHSHHFAIKHFNIEETVARMAKIFSGSC